MRLCLTLVFILLRSGIHAADYVHLTVKDGLPNNTVYYAMQDSKNFIWFCTPTGVSRYDGRKFENFTMADGLADNEIFRCVEDTHHRIWFLSYNGKLSFYLNGKIFSSATTPWLAYNNSGAFLLSSLEDRKKNIWFSTSSGDILKITDSTLTKYKTQFIGKQYNNAYLPSIMLLENDTVKKFIQNDNGIVFIYNPLNQKLKKLGAITKLLDGGISLIKYAPSENEKLFVAERKIMSYQNGTFKTYDLSELNIKHPPEFIFHDANYWWLAIAGDGIYYFKNGCQTCKIIHLLPHETITSILKDNESNMWYTSYNNGVFLQKNYRNITSTLLTGVTNCIAITHDGAKKIFIAGCENSDVKTISLPDKLKTISSSKKSFNRVIGIIPISPSGIIIERDNEIIKYNFATHKQSLISDKPGNKSYYIHDSTIWFCASDHIMKWVNSRLYQDKNVLPYSKLISIAVVSDTIKYIGTLSGLYKIRNNTFYEVLNDSLLKTGINDLKFINGYLWIATHGNGIFILDHDTVFRHINSKNGNIVSDICQKIYDDKRQFIWVATNRGIAVLNRYSLTHLFNITTASGLISNDIKDLVSDSTNLYIAASEGVNILKLQGLQDTASPPNIYITGIKKNNEYILDPGVSYSYTYFKGFITVSFTAVTFQSPHEVEYEYKFEKNSQWHKTQSTDIPIFDLSPGTHTMFFRAKKYNSLWSAPLSLVITVNPLWYQQKRFYILLILFVISAVFYVVQMRIKTIRKAANEKTRLHKKITELQSSSLAHQMNPHFIFNSLNTIQQFILIKEEADGLNYLSEFSMLMRNMLENSRKSHITLKEELTFLDRYLQLEKIRFENKFDYTIKVDNSISQLDIKLPPALFQPILENAIKHGISLMKESGYISLNISLKDQFIEGIVEDNGRGIYTSAEMPKHSKTATALKVLAERMSLLKDNNGNPGKLIIIDKAEVNSTCTGTIIKLLIPFFNGN